MLHVFDHEAHRDLIICGSVGTLCLLIAAVLGARTINIHRTMR